MWGPEERLPSALWGLSRPKSDEELPEGERLRSASFSDPSVGKSPPDSSKFFLWRSSFFSWPPPQAGAGVPELSVELSLGRGASKLGPGCVSATRGRAWSWKLPAGAAEAGEGRECAPHGASLSAFPCWTGSTEEGRDEAEGAVAPAAAPGGAQVLAGAEFSPGFGPMLERPHGALETGGDVPAPPHADVPPTGGDFPVPHVTLPFGTSSTFGSNPRFSSRWLGRLIGFGTEGIFPNTVIPRRAVGPLRSAPNMMAQRKKSKDLQGLQPGSRRPSTSKSRGSKPRSFACFSLPF